MDIFGKIHLSLSIQKYNSIFKKKMFKSIQNLKILENI